jgi:LPS sulfotransferase NodH
MVPLVRARAKVAALERLVAACVSRWPSDHNIAAFHTGRVGSTVVGDLLGQHSEVVWRGEMFEEVARRHGYRPGPGRSAFAMLRTAMRRTREAYFGFETKSLADQHLRWMGLSMPEYIARLKRHRFGRFIVFVRRNYLRQAVSQEVGNQTLAWHTRVDLERPTSVRLDPRRVSFGDRALPLLERFEALDEHYRRLFELLPPRDTLRLTFEEHIERDPRIAYETICDWLGLVPEPVTIRYHRTNPFPLRAIVTNHDEVCETLRGTRYAWMLGDASQD